MTEEPTRTKRITMTRNELNYSEQLFYAFSQLPEHEQLEICLDAVRTLKKAGLVPNNQNRLTP